MDNVQISLESAQSCVRATVARALAHALICGVDECEQEGRPLTQMQRVHLATMSVMAYDNALEACAGLVLEATLLKRMDT